MSEAAPNPGASMSQTSSAILGRISVAEARTGLTVRQMCAQVDRPGAEFWGSLSQRDLVLMRIAAAGHWETAGKKTVCEYSGLHKPASALAPSPVKVSMLDEAQDLVEASERRRLNAGNDFAGQLSSWHVGHLKLTFGKHTRLGLCCFADSRLLQGGGLIEIYQRAGAVPVMMEKAEFFEHLSTDELQEAEIAEFCADFHRIHIAMDAAGLR